MIFNMMVRRIVAKIFINCIFVAFLRDPNQRIVIIIIDGNASEDDYAYIDLEESESVSVPSDWEH